MKPTRERILEFIICYIQDHGYSPSYQEIGEGVGLKSKNSTHCHIMKLLDLGLLETDGEPGSPRALRVPGYKFVRC